MFFCHIVILDRPRRLRCRFFWLLLIILYYVPVHSKSKGNVDIVTWATEAQYFRKKIIKCNNYDEI